jgi:hypothetical protein
MGDNGMTLPGLRLDIAYATGFVVEVRLILDSPFLFPEYIESVV